MMYALLIPIWLTPHEDVDERPRLLDAIERFDAEARERGADLGIVMLANPMDESLGWLDEVRVPVLDVSGIVMDDDYQITFETHLTVEGSGLVANEIAEWLRAAPRWTRGPAPD